ncbi:hypothetical protein C5C03_03360 [Clavibacter michiganensis]|nr:hypothetical protein C5C03_03360 [Clavibacter michiganensis]PPF98006.1 hypothetical protein C5C05_04450 [Clavibacter michiganensis]
MAVILAIDTAGQRVSGVPVSGLGPRVVPTIIAIGLGACALALAVDVLRGGRGAPEESEDADVDAPTDWRTLLMLGALVLGSALLLEPAGYVISSALLFYGSAIVLGSRHFVRDIVIAVVLSVGTFYGFVLGLGVNLPAGVLRGIL